MRIPRLSIYGVIVGVVLSTAAVSIHAAAPARVSGVLMELNKPGTIEVSLSIGRDDGVKPGDKLNVLRDGQVLGKVEITKALAGQSQARILEVVPGKVLSKNDKVETP